MIINSSTEILDHKPLKSKKTQFFFIILLLVNFLAENKEYFKL